MCGQYCEDDSLFLYCYPFTGRKLLKAKSRQNEIQAKCKQKIIRPGKFSPSFKVNISASNLYFKNFHILNGMIYI